MKQSVSLITLGVSDYERAKSFYATLGWSPALEIEETAFYQANSVVLVLWSREKLAADTGIADDGAGWNGIMPAGDDDCRFAMHDQVWMERLLAGAGMNSTISARSSRAVADGGDDFSEGRRSKRVWTQQPLHATCRSRSTATSQDLTRTSSTRLAEAGWTFIAGISTSR